VVGANDELFQAAAFQPLFSALNPRISVTVEPGFGHMAMIADPKACAAIARLWQQLAGVERFDFEVREDMFAGFDGDTAAFARAMKLIEETLAAQPDHAQALVWRGGGRLFLMGQAFQRGAFAEGQALEQQALADLERGVALAPNDLSVRIPRATALQPYARALQRFDRGRGDKLMRVAVDDFEFAVRESLPFWGRLSEHGRGELLGALADGWLSLGNTDKAGIYLERMTTELAGSPYGKNAALRRADPAAKTSLTCMGCH
jgi:hypothetical protein